MAKVRQRTWKIPGQRTKRKAWGFVTVGEDGKQIRIFRSDWSKEDAERALAERTLKTETPRRNAAGITFAQAVERYLAAKVRKRTLTRTSGSSATSKGTSARTRRLPRSRPVG